jgi:hypothetical protein
VLDRFMEALNASNGPALLATLHFPHYRLAGGRMKVWDRPGTYLSDFLARAGADWHGSEWDFRKVISAARAEGSLVPRIKYTYCCSIIVRRAGKATRLQTTRRHWSRGC